MSGRDHPSTSNEPTGPPATRRRRLDAHDHDETTRGIMDDLDRVQSEVEALTERASTEIVLIEQNYNQLKKPLFARRSELISNLSHFWITAMRNHPDLRELIQDHEEECLEHLSNLEVEMNDDMRTGYTIRFFFHENPYFSNEVLAKTYNLGDSSSCESTRIAWKEGYDLTQTQTQTTARPAGNKRRFEQRSFFQWFTDNVESSTDDIAEVIKDDLWANPLLHYLVPDQDNDENGVGSESSSDSTDTDEGSRLKKIISSSSVGSETA